MKLSHERLKSLLAYDLATGHWQWLVNRNGGRGIKIGDEAGYINIRRDGPRRMIKVDGIKYLSSRLAFFYMTKCWPTYQVDHKNLDTLDDRWSNLREATHSQNKANQRKPWNNTTGLKGVSRFRSKYRARIKGVTLGIFDDPEQAHAAYRQAAVQYFGSFAKW